MLIIQIALGVVLAVIILAYWRKILSIGVLSFLIILAISGVCITGYFAYSNQDIIREILIVVLVVSTMIGLIILAKIIGESFSKKLSINTIRRWNLTFGDIVGSILFLSILICGLFSIIQAILIHTIESGYFSIGLALLLIGSIGCFIHFKEIKRSQKQRKIKSSYQE